MTGVRRATTLVELVVVLVLLAILASIAGLAFKATGSLREAPAQEIRLERAQDSATRTGRRVTVTLGTGVHATEATALPDGRVIADSTLTNQVDIGNAP